MTRPKPALVGLPPEEDRIEGLVPPSPPLDPLKDPLPTDVETLQQMVRALAASNDAMAQKLAWFQRMVFGRKSERLPVAPDPGQVSLFDHEPDEGVDEFEDDAVEGVETDATGKRATLQADRPKTQRGGRRETPRSPFRGGTVPHDTPVRTTQHPLVKTCAVCGGPLHVVSTDVRERVEWQPGHFFIEQDLVDNGVCPEHREAGLVSAPGKPYAVAGSVLGNRLLAKVISDKYADNLPLNKQSKRFLRKGVRLGSSTLSRNTIAAAELLVHVVDADREQLLASDWLQGDATGLPIVIGDRGHAERGCLWVYTNGLAAVFEVTLSQHGEHPARFLHGFEGVWLSDGASSYNEASAQPGVQRAGCLAHARRKLFEARSEDPAVYEALALVRDVFLVERTAKTLSDAQRHLLRQEQSRPLVDKLRAWLERHRDTPRPKSALGRALGYLDRQWDRLVLFLEHPDIPVHNNTSELLLRTPVIGRKNWEFAGSVAGAAASAVHFSITASCMLAGADPEAYLYDVLPRLPFATKSQVRELTPMQWALRQPGHSP
jgi:transposase